MAKAPKPPGAKPPGEAASIAAALDWPCLVARGGTACLLDLSVVPNARHTGVDGLHDGALRVRLSAPPVDGKANEMVCDWVAGELGCPKRAVRLLRGPASRRKQLEIDLDAATVAAWLAKVVLPDRE
ncbi:DUF167 domain-containing protein [Ideonella sp. A 288]|uniref:DUF167 domain-containing protein n=1 Tax=Ideonella sp. A 288 TaxID=1962181 RepID=UPI000B4C0332|nr:DUF167 domain-containing protein [Ideonella sp. A 288]